MKLFIFLTSLILSANAFANDDLEEEKRLSAEYLRAVKSEMGTAELFKGVLIRALHKSENTRVPKPTDDITVVYHGYDREGRVFDSSFERESTETFPLNRLIPCWQIAMSKITVGSFYKITCPSDTAYGDKGAGNVIKPGAAISFRVMLMDISNFN